jgi:hypothetical protein
MQIRKLFEKSNLFGGIIFAYLFFIPANSLALITTPWGGIAQDYRILSPYWEKAETALPSLQLDLLSQQITLPEPDKQFIQQVTKATWWGFNAMVNPKTGLPYDYVDINNPQSPSYDGQKVSPTEIGLWLTSIVAARDLGYIQAREAEEKVRKVLSSLETIKKNGDAPHGFFYWFYDAASERLGKRTYFLSSVDNGNLAAGLMVIAEAFKGTDIPQRAKVILNDMDFKFFYNPTVGLMNHGFDIQTQKYSPYDYGVFNTEARLSVLIALLKDGMPKQAWDNMRNLTKIYRTKTGEGIPVAASWGGSAFENFYSDMYFNETKYAPNSMGENNKRVARIHLQEHPQKLGITIGGWAPSQDVDGVYKESGVPDIGERGYPSRQVSPYSVFLAFRFNPEKAMEVLKNMAKLNTQVYNDKIGYVDAIDPNTGKVGPNILSLDKGMELVSLFNLVQAFQNKEGIEKYFWGYLAGIGKDKEGQKILGERKFEPSFYISPPPPPPTRPPLNILGKAYQIGSFYDPKMYPPGVAGARESWVEDPERGRVLKGEYNVEPPGSFSGLFIKVALEVSGYDTLNFGVKGDKSGFPKVFRIELKYQGGIKQNINVSNISTSWKDLSFSLSPDLGKIDEVVVVFEHSLAEVYKGAIYIDPQKFTLSQKGTPQSGPTIPQWAKDIIGASEFEKVEKTFEELVSLPKPVIVGLTINNQYTYFVIDRIETANNQIYYRRYDETQKKVISEFASIDTFKKFWLKDSRGDVYLAKK